ncbi:hypothetical protein [Pararobbsia alpina]|uniref:Uncharacterized protein n=1 Tax=Pararobbsia alpina TaxID=621374 RepID=A0A6S7D3X5_9BURK|nr:hypothetical protein [Pararobbsia alpina]CAB3805850.1 hypothetical protein LMG28138_05724 [Pararobbsia alpina]
MSIVEGFSLGIFGRALNGRESGPNFKPEGYLATLIHLLDRAVSAEYRSTVLAAFQDVEDNAALLHWLDLEVAHEDAAVTASQHTLDIANNLYSISTGRARTAISTS